MIQHKPNQKKYMIPLCLTIAAWAILMVVLLPSCGKKENLAEAVGKGDSSQTCAPPE